MTEVAVLQTELPEVFALASKAEMSATTDARRMLPCSPGAGGGGQVDTCARWFGHPNQRAPEALDPGARHAWRRYSQPPEGCRAAGNLGNAVVKRFRVEADLVFRATIQVEAADAAEAMAKFSRGEFEVVSRDEAPSKWSLSGGEVVVEDVVPTKRRR